MMKRGQTKWIGCDLSGFPYLVRAHLYVGGAQISARSGVGHFMQTAYAAEAVMLTAFILYPCHDLAM